MKPFNHKQRNLFAGPHLLGPLLLLAGVFALLSPIIFNIELPMDRVLIVGISALIIGLTIIFSYGGTLIDSSQAKYKEYFSLAGFKIGQWKQLPEVTRVKVVSRSYSASNTPNGVSPTFSGKVTEHKVLLYSTAPTPLFSFGYTRIEKATQSGKQLANVLNIPLMKP